MTDPQSLWLELSRGAANLPLQRTVGLPEEEVS